MDQVQALPAANAPKGPFPEHSPSALKKAPQKEHVGLLERRLQQRTQPPAACAARYGSCLLWHLGETSVFRVARAFGRMSLRPPGRAAAAAAAA